MPNWSKSAREGFTFEWRGEELKGEVKAAVKEAVEQTLDLAVTLSKRYAPVRTGLLRDSIRRDDVRVAYNTIRGSFGTYGEVFYDIFQELGTVRNRPRPHHRPAADRAFPGLAARIGVSLKRYATNYTAGTYRK